MDIFSTPEFERWVNELDPKGRAQVDDRLDRIREHNHFGDKRYLGDDLFELRWKNGRRVYYAIAVGTLALMLLGGDKNGQNRDIARSRKILERETA